MAQKPRTKTRRPSETARPGILQPAFQLMFMAGLLAIAFYFCFSLFTANSEGPAGLINNWFGHLAYLLPFTLAVWGWRVFGRGVLIELKSEMLILRLLGLLAALAGGCGLATLHLQPIAGIGSAGGAVGDMLGPGLIDLLGVLIESPFLPVNVFLAMLFGTGFMLATGLTWLGILDVLGGAVLLIVAGFSRVVDWLTASSATDWENAEADAEDADEEEPPAAEPVVETVAKPQSARRAAKPTGKPATKAPKAKSPPPKSRASRIEPSFDEVIEEELSLVIDDESELLVNEEFELEKEEPPKPPVPKKAKAKSAPSKRAKTRPDPPATPKPPPRRNERPTIKPSAPPVYENRNQQLPPLDLIDRPQTQRVDDSPEAQNKMARLVEILLQRFGVQATVEGVESGPVITCFELEPAPGVKASQITNLAKDLARGLSVASVRVLEVIPGKSVVGLEVPNPEREIVFLSDIIKSAVYCESDTPLTLALGLDSSGQPVVANLAAMPHMLVAGTTGSGKSVAINAMLLSMLYKATAQELRLILVDPKLLELPIYDDIPHLLTPVVTDMREAANALRWCVGEMERRYRLMAAQRVRNIGAFNKKVEEAIAAGQPLTDPLWDPEHAQFPGGAPPNLETLPYIVVIIDELADMMMVVGKQVETLIARLAQKARAAGIHLILATQRPSVDVITGLIKANIPGRISFKVSSKVDSRTILDQMGAEQLLGYGDMLFLPPGTGFPARVHGAFVDDDEINRVVEYLKQTGEPDYMDAIVQDDEDDGSEANGEKDRPINRHGDELL